MEDKYLGIDIGGTKSRFVIGNAKGGELFSSESEGINLHNLNPSQVDARLFSLFSKTLLDQDSVHFKSILVGLTSYDSPQDQQLWGKIITAAISKQNISFQSLYLTSDTFIALKSGANETPAMCLICGTGTSCYGLNQSLEEYKAGDWGHLLGDQGSAYWIGSKLLRLTVKELDGRQPKTSLSSAILKATNSSDLNQLISWAYQPAGIKEIASMSKLLSHAEISSLPQVRFVLHKAMEQLNASISSVYQQLNVDTNMTLVCVGGMFDSEVFKSNFLSSVSRTLPYVKPLFTDFSPHQSALNLARESSPNSFFPISTQIMNS